MSSAAALYNAEVLGLAVSLANFPLSDDLPLRASARAPLCGSSIELALELGPTGTIARIGLKAHACAIGQAAAALFAAAAPGQNRAGIAAALGEIETWLADVAAPLPGWPGLPAIAAARGYPARHGAILLSWKAALVALP
jgi:NifU-like protein involved in Fe-S cluster formation